MKNKIRKILTEFEVRASEIESIIPYRGREWNTRIKKEIAASLKEFYERGLSHGKNGKPVSQEEMLDQLAALKRTEGK